MREGVPWAWNGAIRCDIHGLPIVITTLYRRVVVGDPRQVRPKLERVRVGQISFCPRCPPDHQLEWPLRLGDRRRAA